MLHDLQARMRAALLGGDDAPLAGRIGGGGAVPAARRLAVHRNTILASLTEALASAFPVVRRLVGEAFFNAAAAAFIRRSPPDAPDLAAYGAAFPAFLEGFPPAAGLTYLADVARLERARVEATFAADAVPLDPATLADVPAAQVPSLAFRPHPSARIVTSRWPVQTIWDAHRTDPVGPVDLGSGGESVLVLRHGARLAIHRLGAEEAVFLAALLAGRTLGEAGAAGDAAGPGFDLRAALAAALCAGAFAGVRAPNDDQG